MRMHRAGRNLWREKSTKAWPASINDREAQLRGGYLEMIANPSQSSHGLENLAGCDGVLFKTIARLGRLNMLSQHRPVLDEALSSQPRESRPAPLNPRPRLAGQALVDFYNLHAHSFDGNGFSSTLDDDSGFTLLTNSTSHDDLRTTFWSEWKAARQALHDWEFDPARLLATLPAAPVGNQLRDFGYISEAFRYAALLYTERLACPNLPSSHLNFQNLVSQVLYYVTSLDPSSGGTPNIVGDSGPAAGKGLVLTGSGDKTVKIWSLSDYSCLRTFEGHTNRVTCRDELMVFLNGERTVNG